LLGLSNNYGNSSNSPGRLPIQMKNNQTHKPEIGKAAKISLSVVIAALLVMVSYFSSYLNQANQAIFAAIFTLGILAIGSSGSALLIGLIGGVAYSFVSPHLGFIMLLPWVVRGVTTSSILKVTNTFARESIPSAYKVAAAMTVGSLLTGLVQYFWLIKLLKVVPDTPAVLLLTETAIVIAMVSTLVVSFLATKYLFKRIKPILFW
jgi:hypothetical protein